MCIAHHNFRQMTTTRNAAVPEPVKEPTRKIILPEVYIIETGSPDVFAVSYSVMILHF